MVAIHSSLRRTAARSPAGIMVPVLSAILLLATPMAAQAHRTQHQGHDDPSAAPGNPAAVSPPASSSLLAPGYGLLEFEPPAPGTYALPPLKPAADGAVLTSAGDASHLHELYGDKLVLLSFIYTSCSDINGCPLATLVLRQIMQRLGAEPRIADQLRLLTLSFDPERDTPEAMRAYGDHFRDSRVEWRFLTTRSAAELDPILDAYGQPVAREYGEDGQFSGSFSHILRVFLIDRARQIRNIYSVSFLHADTLLSDIRTLLLEQGESKPPATVATTTAPRLHGAGDNKQGYDSAGYVTRSRRLAARTGRAADLLALSRSPPLGLPELPAPNTSPLTTARIDLGRKLFFDRRLSPNDTFSCAMCHIPEQGFTSNELATAVGIEGRTVRRNSPTLYNVGYLQRLFHDARETSLEQQVWSPLLARNEMGNPSIGYVIGKIESLPEYDGLFEAAFDGRGPGMETVGMALASYQRTLVAGASPFDRWRFGGDKDALGAAARRGFDLFTGEAGCVSCHTIGKEFALFTDQRLHNTGVGYRQTMDGEPEVRQVQLAPGVFADVARSSYAAAAEKPPADLGYYEITRDPADRWRYRTPSLRNVALTAPYMHDGSLKTLREVIGFYNRGGIANDNLDPLIRPLNLSEEEITDLVRLLESLTGDNIDLLIADAFAAPIGDR